MAFEEFWWSLAGGGPDPDPGFPIPESLRFPGNAFLTSVDAQGTNQFTVPAGDFTLSMWVKFTATATDNQTVYGNNDSSRGFKTSSPANTATGPVRMVSRSPGQGMASFGGGALRDPAAWYNFVFQCESNVVTCWQNGVRYPDTPGMFDRTGEVLIGCGQPNATPDEPLRGYMAQIVCLDGTLEPPTSFGRFNDNDIWVPIEIDGQFTAAQYGTNGFWLTFDNINNVGEDSAPIGATGHTVARNFRGVGFDTMPPGRFSENIAASAAGNYQADAANRTLQVINPAQAFNGDLSNQAQANASAAWIYWTTNLVCNTVTLIVNNDNDQTANTTRINGTQVVTPAATLVGNNFEQTFNVAGGTLTEFAFMNQGGPNTSIFGMRIDDGPVLVDNDGTGFDPMTDSPTQNFATGNAINNPAANSNLVPILGNLGNDQSTGGVFGGLQPTMPWDANAHLFFEVLVSNYPFNSWFGFNGNPGPNAQTGTTGAGVSNGVINWAMNGGSPLGTMATADGPFTGITWTPNFTVNENVVAGWEWDGPNRRIRYYENGVLRSTSSQWAAGSFDTANFFFGYNASPTAPWTYNFGQQPMTNPPADTIRLQTNDLPDAPILNGRDHFQALTGPGGGGFQLFSSQSRDETLGIEEFENEGPCPGNTVQAEQFILDCFLDVTTTEFTISNGWGWLGGNARISVSVDGSENSWTVTNANQTMGNGETITITNADDFRFVKLFYLSNSGGVNFGDITTDNNPILFRAQQTFANGLYIFKSRTGTEQWQYFDSINGEDGVFRTPGNTAPDDFFAPAGTALAWCWNAPDAFDNDDIDSGFRNVDAGFSIIQYTGDGTTERDIEHGLDRTPGLIINWQPVNGDVRFWINGLTGTGELTQNLVLNTGEAASNMFSSGLIHAPTGTQNVTVGLDNPADPTRNVLAVNETGRVYTQYIWAPIPGYSAFGSFTGTSADNGPFIYCGFKPALVWLQAADTGGGDAFFTADTTCQLFNPYGEGTLLNMAQTGTEGSNTARPWDILSNGFKIRNSSGSINSGNVVWAAWAENPFGGENTIPVPAH